MKKLLYLLPIAVIGIIALFSLTSSTPETTPSSPQPLPQAEVQTEEKIYVALEDEGVVGVIDALTRNVTARIDLSEERAGVRTQYMAHNVQVAPNGKSVWVTANAMQEKAMSVGHTEENTEESADQIIVIDPLTDKIVKRIPIATDSHLAHIIISNSDGFKKDDKSFKID